MVCGLVVGGTRGGGVVERGLACGHRRQLWIEAQVRPGASPPSVLECQGLSKRPISKILQITREKEDLL